MNKLISELKKLAELYPLLKNFDWDIPDDCPLTIPNEITGAFDRNLYLKHHLSPYISEEQPLSNRYWVIHKWGGIRSFKQNVRNDTILKKLDAELEIGRLTRPSFSVISSISKVASFINHHEYAIYDSRVIYSLNWLLFKYTHEPKLFPQPSGRNVDISRFELSTIFNLSKKELTYKSYKIAYHEYCTLLKLLAKEVYGRAEPYLVEMLLFIIAPNYIVSDIVKSVKIEILD